MKFGRLGSTGLEISRICVGGMSFGAPASGNHTWTLERDQSLPIIRRALELGVNFFDTANVYSAGTAEEILGEGLEKYGHRDELVIATKVHGRVRPGANGGGLSRKSILAEVDNSLRRLRVDYVDLLQIHRWDPVVPIEETIEALHDIVKAGKARYLGASSMAAWQFSKALYTADLGGWTRFVSMQDHYNLLDRSEEREMHPLCADQGIGVVPWSPLARGRLTRPWDSSSNRMANDDMGDRLYRQADREVVDRLESVSDDLGLPMAQIALAWVLRQPLVSAPIVGATKMEHLEQAAAAVDLDLSDSDVERLVGP